MSARLWPPAESVAISTRGHALVSSVTGLARETIRHGRRELPGKSSPWPVVILAAEAGRTRTTPHRQQGVREQHRSRSPERGLDGGEQVRVGGDAHELRRLAQRTEERRDRKRPTKTVLNALPQSATLPGGTDQAARWAPMV